MKMYIARKLLKFALWLMHDDRPSVFQVRMVAHINGNLYGTTRTISRALAPATRLELQQNMIEMTGRIVKDLEQGWMH